MNDIPIFPSDNWNGEPGEPPEEFWLNKQSWASLYAQNCEIQWAWPNWIPIGFLTLLVSKSGLGKSTLALRFAACFTDGWDWLDGTPYTGELGYVVWCEAEAGQYMNTSRAYRMGLTAERIISPLTDPMDDFSLSIPEHRKALEDYCALDYVRLIIVDSLRGAIDGDENSSELSKELKYLADLAKKHQKPILVVHHLRKSSIYDSPDSVDMDQIRGSSAFQQFPRSIMALNIPNPNFPDKRKLEIRKSNLAPFPQPIIITITEHGIDTLPDAGNWMTARLKTQRDIAIDFLKNYLEDGFKYSTDIYAKGKARGLDRQTLQRAKQDLGIIARKDGRKWVWELPQ